MKWYSEFVPHEWVPMPVRLRVNMKSPDTFITSRMCKNCFVCSCELRSNKSCNGARRGQPLPAACAVNLSYTPRIKK
jgi:hypothetical protein